MGIHPYGLFGTYESNNPFGSDYEIRHQLDARKSQLDALSKKENLSENELNKKEQLNKAVNTLQSRLEDKAPAKDTNKVLVKDTNIAIKNSSPNTLTLPEGTVIAKSPLSNASTVNKSSDSYLKGFFLDLKI